MFKDYKIVYMHIAQRQHYENTPIQVYWKFYHQKKKKKKKKKESFQIKIL